ncbi:hypothetical protein H5410_001746 [Solanum commersonii]|uniref:Uncharacterized protein n=1 Tax=Solanum commersonii TaxID=4109 RepID=A0A9J6AZM9_SOLCO|nr:hypothetical protein H5410_001746 [Solanum commersonii]
MANMLRANQAARAIYKPKGLIVYGECNRCLLASVNAFDSCQAFAPGGPIGVSIALVESIMARATQKWVHSNKKDGRNKRKKSWDEHVVEEYEKEQPQILTNQLEWTLNIRSKNGKNKKIKKDEDEKLDGFEMYVKTKRKAIKKLHLAQVGESTSSNNHNCPNEEVLLLLL